MDCRRAGHVWSVVLVSVALATLGTGCLDRKLKPLNPCLVSGVVAEISVNNIDKVDLLFMVDNSGSMREEQAALREQFPNMVRVLTSGDRDNDMVQDFPPATDLNLAVVSSDMGLFGVNGITGCENLGDNGEMQNLGDTAIAGCQATYPAKFLHYEEGQGVSPTALGADFGCIASLGTEGCGFEQQLESVLKALWPANDLGGNGATQGTTAASPNRILFVGDATTGFGVTGHGDGINAGFLRNDPTVGLSLIAVIVVTDEEDCSSARLEHFVPANQLDANSMLAMQDLNLRCFYNKGNLFAVDRYRDGLLALRPDAPQLVIFGGIVGVPEDLVNAEARANVNFDNEDERNAYYQRILNDQRMVETIDPMRAPGEGNLLPSCTSGDSRAYPPRRIVEVASLFGANGVIQSICQPDFTNAMDAIIEVIAKQLGAVCLPRELVADSDGKVGCDVLWQLPKPLTAPPMTPTSCSQRPFLEFVENTKDGELCRVTQIAVPDRAVPGPGAGDGWYYDDFSEEVLKSCGTTPQRVAFTTMATPGTGVTVQLECLNETQSLVSNRTDIAVGSTVYQPTVGSPCKDVEFPKGSGNRLMGNDACQTTLQNGMKVSEMFCHAEANVCVQPCSSNSQCPAAWVCDDRPEVVGVSGGGAYCTNPTCGTGEEE